MNAEFCRRDKDVCPDCRGPVLIEGVVKCRKENKKACPKCGKDVYPKFDQMRLLEIFDCACGNYFISHQE